MANDDNEGDSIPFRTPTSADVCSRSECNLFSLKTNDVHRSLQELENNETFA